MLPRDFAGQSLLRTQVRISSRSSVQSHWRFEHYVQSLCHAVLHAVRNLTKITGDGVGQLTGNPDDRERIGCFAGVVGRTGNSPTAALHILWKE